VSIKKLGDGRYEWRHRVGGRHLKKTFARRTDAVAHDSKVKADLARGTHVDTSNRVTVAEYARAWSQARVLRSNTRHGHDNFLRHHLEATPLGDRPIVRVRPSEVQAWITGRAAVVGPATLRGHVGLLRWGSPPRSLTGWSPATRCCRTGGCRCRGRIRRSSSR